MSRKETTLVLGCTGVIGGRVAERLWDRGNRIRAGSRLADPAFDWLEPAGWPAVVDGVTRVYVTLPADPEVGDLEGRLDRFLEVAAQGGVRHVVFHSRAGERRSGALEQVVQTAGLDWTIVRVARLVPGLAEPFVAERFGDRDGEQAVRHDPVIDADHVADAIVAVLTSGDHTGRVYDLTTLQPGTYAGMIAVPREG